MIPLSIAIITLNEEKNIARCLQSIQGLAAEIIVVDSFSTDNTEAICKTFNCRFIQKKFLGYIEQKNKALEYCTHDLVLCLDADECLNTTLFKQIVQLLQTGINADAYSMNRCTNFCGKWIRHGTWYPDKKIRLINKLKGKWGGVNPHDELIMQNGAKVSHLQGDIEHYSYNSIEEVITQNNKFTSIQAKAMFNNGKRSSWFKIAVNPCVAFISGYILKLGILDGFEGYFIAKSVAYQTLSKYVKLKNLETRGTV